MNNLTPPASVGIVFGTYNRLALLKRAIASIRRGIGDLRHEIIVVDGGSTDGSSEWVVEQPRVTLIQQEGPLTGAVAAFNLGFGHAVDQGHPWVMHLNDDAEIVTPRAIVSAVARMESDVTIGEVAFELDLRGDWGFEYINGAPYANFGVIRRDAGIAVAKAQGDPTGRVWWNPIYRTYGADTEFGCWLWKLGYQVFPGKGLRVHDLNAQDELRAGNVAIADSEKFWSRWRNESFDRSVAKYRTLPPPRRRGLGRAGETPRKR